MGESLRTISPWIALASAIVAVVSAYFSVMGARTQMRVADFNNCFELLKQYREAIGRANSAEGEELRREIRELLNLFEVMALLINGRKIASSGSYLAKNLLLEAWVWLEVTEGLAPIVEEAITGVNTFGQLRRFRRRYKKEIDDLLGAERMRCSRAEACMQPEG